MDATQLASYSDGTIDMNMVDEQLSVESIKNQWMCRPPIEIQVSPTEYDLWKKKSPDSLHYRVYGSIERYL